MIDCITTGNNLRAIKSLQYKKMYEKHIGTKKVNIFFPPFGLKPNSHFNTAYYTPVSFVRIWSSLRRIMLIVDVLL